MIEKLCVLAVEHGKTAGGYRGEPLTRGSLLTCRPISDYYSNHYLPFAGAIQLANQC